MSARLYDNICSSVQSQLYSYMEAADITNLFSPVSVGDDILETMIFRYLDKVGRAALSSDLWNPSKVRLSLQTLAMSRYSAGIQADLDYKSWKILEKMPNVMVTGLDAIGAQPGIQAGHYLIQGTELRDDLSRGAKMADAQYNFILDVGANSLASTITRPIGVNQATGTPNTWPASAGAWSTSANMITDINNGVGELANKGFNKDTTLCFYPNSASSAMMKKRPSAAGDGYINAFNVLADVGISQGRVMPFDDIYGYTIAGAAPAKAAFDLLFIDYAAMRVFRTVDPWVNVFIHNTGTKYPSMTIEAGETFMPVFQPHYHQADAKWYKGVSVVRAVNGT